MFSIKLICFLCSFFIFKNVGKQKSVRKAKKLYKYVKNVKAFFASTNANKKLSWKILRRDVSEKSRPTLYRLCKMQIEKNKSSPITRGLQTVR